MLNSTQQKCVCMYASVRFENHTLVHNCLIRVASPYPKTSCTSVSSLPGRSTLRSAARGLRVVSRMHWATVQSRSFAYIGPSRCDHLLQKLPLELLSLSSSVLE